MKMSEMWRAAVPIRFGGDVLAHLIDSCAAVLPKARTISGFDVLGRGIFCHGPSRPNALQTIGIMRIFGGPVNKMG